MKVEAEILQKALDELRDEYVALAKRQVEIKQRISEISMQLYEIEFPDMQTEYVPPGEPKS